MIMLSLLFAVRLDRLRSDVSFKALPWARNMRDGEVAFVCTAEAGWLAESYGNVSRPLIFSLGQWTDPRWAKAGRIFSQRVNGSVLSFEAPCEVVFSRTTGVAKCAVQLSAVKAKLSI